MNAVSLAQDSSVIEKSRRTSENLNRHLMTYAIDSGEIAFLGSPVTGGGHVVGRFEQLFLSAMNQKQGLKAVDLGKSVWKILQQQGQKLVREGKAIETEEENITELVKQAEVFLEKR